MKTNITKQVNKGRFSFLKNRNILRMIFVGGVVVSLIGGYLFYQKTMDRVFIDTSLISAPVITISPSTGGKLQRMNVTEGQFVTKGDTLGVVGSETLHADTDGLIIMADNELGSSTTTQTPIVQMIRQSDMRVAGTIDENKGLNTIKAGQPVSFTVDAFPGNTYWGYVDEISPSAKQTQVSFSISNERPTQQFVVYARFNAAMYPEIKNGMSAKMIIYTR